MARLQHRGPGDVDEVARVPGGVVVQRGGHVAAFRTAQAVPVVVVDRPERALPGVHLRGDGLVVRQLAPVFLQPLQPGFGGRLALELDDRGDQRLEVRLGRGEGELALVAGVGEFEDRAGQLRRLQLGGVVDEHRDPSGDPHPDALRGVVARGDGAQRGRRGGRQQPVLTQRFQRRGVLGVEDVGRGLGALLDDLVGQRRLVVAAHGGLDPLKFGVTPSSTPPCLEGLFARVVNDPSHDLLPLVPRVIHREQHLDGKDRCADLDH